MGSDVTGAQSTLNNPHIWSVDSVENCSIKVKGDKTCVISGCCVLPTGEILLADWSNKRLKKLNDRYQVISVCDLPNIPEDVCYCGNNEAVLGIWFDILQFVDVRGGMSLTRTVKTSPVGCNGLACHGNLLYVADKSSVYIYSTDGIKQRVLYAHPPGRVDFRHIAVSDNGNYIYITDHFTGFHTIDSSGNHLYTYTNPELGRKGICVDDEGHVLMNNQSNDVLQISSDGKQKLGLITVRTSVLYTNALCFIRDNATLITAGFGMAVLKLK